MRTKFIYFDLGRVLLDFDLDLMVSQMAKVAGIDSLALHSTIFETDLDRSYELGRITTDEFFATISETHGCSFDRERIELATNDIFTEIPHSQEMVAWLRGLGYPLGILSNTCDGHWEFCRRRFPWMDEHFDVHVASHQVGAMKPDPAIYRAATDRAGCRPEEIVFVDDLLENVEGARRFGFDAIHYTTGPEVEAALRERVQPVGQDIS